MVDTQQIGGYRSFNLLNAANDPTFVRTVLYSHIANQYLPAPKTNFVRVVINGEHWGTYISAQQFNRDFLRDMYRTTNAARWHVPGSPGARAGLEYLGDSVAPYRAKYELKSKDTPDKWQSLIQLTRVLNQTPADQLEAALAPLLDIDGALRFLAVDNALVNSDGYWTRASDYNMVQDSTGKFSIVPHDMNEGLGAGEGGPGGRGGRGGRGGPPGGFGGGPPGGMPPGGMPPGGMPPGGCRRVGCRRVAAVGASAAGRWCRLPRSSTRWWVSITPPHRCARSCCRARAPYTVSAIRTTDRRTGPRLEDGRTARGAVSIAHRRRCRARYAQAVQHRVLSDRGGVAPHLYRDAARVPTRENSGQRNTLRSSR